LRLFFDCGRGTAVVNAPRAALLCAICVDCTAHAVKYVAVGDDWRPTEPKYFDTSTVIASLRRFGAFCYVSYTQTESVSGC